MPIGNFNKENEIVRTYNTEKENAIATSSFNVYNNRNSTNLTIFGGRNIVKHKLINEELFLIGFTIDENLKNKTILSVTNKINSTTKYSVYSHNIYYPKLVINIEKTAPSFLTNLDSIEYNDSDSVKSSTIEKEEFKKNINKFNYFLFKDVLSDEPVLVSERIFAVCGYSKNGEINYKILNLNELDFIQPNI